MSPYLSLVILPAGLAVLCALVGGFFEVLARFYSWLERRGWC